MATETDNAQRQAKAKLNSILGMVERLNHTQECDGDPGTCGLSHADLFGGLNVYFDGTKEPTASDYEEYHDEEKAREAIEESALSVEVRSDWHVPGDENEGPDEYRILLCTGGPAVQIVGSLNKYQEPETANLQYQDWFTFWENYSLTADEVDALLAYAQVFYFGA